MPGAWIRPRSRPIGRSATGGLLPDLTIVLDVPPETARGPRRSGATGSRTGRPNITSAVREGFLELARRLAQRKRVVPVPGAGRRWSDRDGPIADTVFKLIRQSEVMLVLALDPRP